MHNTPFKHQSTHISTSIITYTRIVCTYYLPNYVIVKTGQFSSIMMEVNIVY